MSDQNLQDPVNEAGATLASTAHKAFQAGLGAVDTAREGANDRLSQIQEEIVSLWNKLAERGESIEAKGREQIESAVASGRESVEARYTSIRNAVSERYTSTLESVNLPTKDAIDGLSNQIGKLNTKINKLGK